MSGPHPDPLALDAHLEPAALFATVDADGPEDLQRAVLSLAISAKRIADAIGQLGSDGNFANLDQMAWTLGQTFGRGFEIGSRR